MITIDSGLMEMIGRMVVIGGLGLMISATVATAFLMMMRANPRSGKTTFAGTAITLALTGVWCYWGADIFFKDAPRALKASEIGNNRVAAINGTLDTISRWLPELEAKAKSLNPPNSNMVARVEKANADLLKLLGDVAFAGSTEGMSDREKAVEQLYVQPLRLEKFDERAGALACSVYAMRWEMGMR